MCIYGSIYVKDGQKESVKKFEINGDQVDRKFHYTIPFLDYFDYRHAVDDKNNIFHMLPSIEST